MTLSTRVLCAAAAIALSACATLDDGFPAAATHKTADQVIGEVWLDRPLPRSKDFSAEIERLTGDMQARFRQIRPYVEQGAVGVDADGFLAVRDYEMVPAEARNDLRALVASDNADRSALYAELAHRLDHPGWETPIRRAFAERWQALAAPGWFVQSSAGAWTQK